jgi:hypothetical protein
MPRMPRHCTNVLRVRPTVDASVPVGINSPWASAACSEVRVVKRKLSRDSDVNSTRFVSAKARRRGDVLAQRDDDFAEWVPR